ncbi:hypothetical protein BO94DRAFT_570406 [Aspergillus sclerotioniger CBS 115572]|uniref:Uncharacterized protein n=1 Tax=Aspergillus sclerotioniger CBS 115572 TaxID=1450535 RepID=A0A317UT99_9EURO|nr:hypothetical protein BO94DRAFT_570406 [Aspergillus sclerotioniger CBS 115572]PWY65283.1 hypothetical protein BO94DRAFT_570406 [Aspergillus sclerotioniger CBS 115572]
MNLPGYYSTNTVEDLMPHLPIDQRGSFVTSPSIRKRKREQVQADIVSTSSDRLVPSSIQYTNPQFRLDYPELSGQSRGVFTRQRCLHRKRRVQQPHTHRRSPFTENLSHTLQSNSSQTKISSQNIYVSAALEVNSPPVSPRTTSPNPYQQPQTLCASAFCLRSCHICHRKPTTREFIDAYADCDLCGQRSCHICLRYCDAIDCSGLVKMPTFNFQESANSDGMQTQRARKVCSACAVEGVTEAGMEVARCLECVRGFQPQFQAVHPD